MKSVLIGASVSMALLACSSDDTSSPSGGTGDPCNKLCTEANFTSGELQDFGPVKECICSGAGKGIAKTSCESYCAAFSVAPAKSFLSKKNIANDKCVCDGT